MYKEKRFNWLMVLQAVQEAWCQHLLSFWEGLRKLTHGRGEGQAGTSYMARECGERCCILFKTTRSYDNSLTHYHKNTTEGMVLIHS